MAPWVAFVLALRAVGVYALVVGASSLVSAAAFVIHVNTIAAPGFPAPSSVFEWWGHFAPGAIWCATGGVALFQAPRIADRFYRRESPAPAAPAARAEALFEIGVRLIGVWVLAGAVGTLATAGLNAWAGLDSDFERDPLGLALEGAANGAIGMLLLVGPRRLGAALRRHVAPVPAPLPEEPPDPTAPH